MKNKKLLADVALILSLIIVALVLFFALRPKDEGNFAVVEIDGKEVASYSLEKDGVYSLNNGTNTLVIQNGYAMVSEANCPDKICVKQGRIKYQGQTIVCLPNKLMVKIIQNNGGLDLVI